MKIDIAAICDAATVEGGKFNLLGVFDTFFTEQFPLVYPYCSIAFKVRLEEKDERPKKFKMKIVDENGKEVLPPAETEVNYYKKKPSTKDPNKGTLNLAFSIAGLKLEKAGVYKIQLSKNGKILKELPLFAKKGEKEV